MKILMPFLLVLLLCIQSAFAASRMDRLLDQDAMEALEVIFFKKIEIHENKELLLGVEAKLKKAKKGQAIYVQMRNIGGTLTIMAIVIGTYKAHFPLGMRFLLGTYLSMSDAGNKMIKLNLGDIQKLNRELLKAQAKIALMEKELNQQIKYFCKEDSRHQLCY